MSFRIESPRDPGSEPSCTPNVVANQRAKGGEAEDVIDGLRRLGPVEVSELTGRQETIEFRLPPELTDGLTAGRATAKV